MRIATQSIRPGILHSGGPRRGPRAARGRRRLFDGLLGAAAAGSSRGHVDFDVTNASCCGGRTARTRGPNRTTSRRVDIKRLPSRTPPVPAPRIHRRGPRIKVHILFHFNVPLSEFGPFGPTATRVGRESRPSVLSRRVARPAQQHSGPAHPCCAGHRAQNPATQPAQTRRATPQRFHRGGHFPLALADGLVEQSPRFLLTPAMSSRTRQRGGSARGPTARRFLTLPCAEHLVEQPASRRGRVWAGRSAGVDVGRAVASGPRRDRQELLRTMGSRGGGERTCASCGARRGGAGSGQAERCGGGEVTMWECRVQQGGAGSFSRYAGVGAVRASPDPDRCSAESSVAIRAAKGPAGARRQYRPGARGAAAGRWRSRIAKRTDTAQPGVARGGKRTELEVLKGGNQPITPLRVRALKRRQGAAKVSAPSSSPAHCASAVERKSVASCQVRGPRGARGGQGGVRAASTARPHTHRALMTRGGRARQWREHRVRGVRRGDGEGEGY